MSLLLVVHPQTLTRGAKLGSSLPHKSEQMAVWSNSKINIAFKIQSKLQICFKLIFIKDKECLLECDTYRN